MWYNESMQDPDPLIPAFLLSQPQAFSTTPDKCDERGVFATPRTWAMLGRALAVGRATDMMLPLAEGYIGKHNAAMLVAFDRLRTDLNPAAYLRNPEKVVPNPAEFAKNMDQLIALISSMSEYVGRELKGMRTNKKGKSGIESIREMTLLYLSGLAHVTDTRADLVSTSVSLFLMHGGETSDVIDAISFGNAMKNPKFKKLMSNIALAISPSKSK
jgi:hypothetical protein